VHLILMSHGGSGHKRPGRRFAGESLIAAATLDGPFPGDRAATLLEARQYQERIVAVSV